MKHIIARFEEDISWSDGLDKFVVQKGEHVPNTGREAASWLWYIVQHYEELDGTYAFRQGEPTGPYHGILWEGTLAKELADYHYDIKPLADRLGVELPETLWYYLGSQYDVDAEVIRLRSKEWYEDALICANTVEKGPWLFERLWPYIWYNKTKAWIPKQ
jgi:hypothetical protein